MPNFALFSTHIITGTVHTFAKAHLTSVAIRIHIRIRMWIRDPDRHQDLIVCSLAHCHSSLKISCQSVRKFLREVANRQTDRQTDRQTTMITSSLTEVIILRYRPSVVVFTLFVIISLTIYNVNSFQYDRDKSNIIVLRNLKINFMFVLICYAKLLRPIVINGIYAIWDVSLWLRCVHSVNLFTVR